MHLPQGTPPSGFEGGSPTMHRKSTTSPAEAERYLRRLGFEKAGASIWHRITKRRRWLAIVLTTSSGSLAAWWLR